jgi:hypothetical protein
MHEERADGCKCIKSNKQKPQISIVMPAEILVLIRFILSYFHALSKPNTHTYAERERQREREREHGSPTKTENHQAGQEENKGKINRT